MAKVRTIIPCVRSRNELIEGYRLQNGGRQQAWHDDYHQDVMTTMLDLADGHPIITTPTLMKTLGYIDGFPDHFTIVVGGTMRPSTHRCVYVLTLEDAFDYVSDTAVMFGTEHYPCDLFRDPPITTPSRDYFYYVVGCDTALAAPDKGKAVSLPPNLSGVDTVIEETNQWPTSSLFVTLQITPK